MTEPVPITSQRRVPRLDLVIALIIIVVVALRLASPRVETLPYKDLLADASTEELRARLTDTTLPKALRERAMTHYLAKAGAEAAVRLSLSQLADTADTPALTADGEASVRSLFVTTIAAHPVAEGVEELATACVAGTIQDAEWFDTIRPAWSQTCTAFAWRRLLALHRESSATAEPWSDASYPWLLEVLATGPYAWRVMDEANAFFLGTAAADPMPALDVRLGRAAVLVDADEVPNYRDAVVRLVREVILVQNRWPSEGEPASTFAPMFLSLLRPIRDDADLRNLLTPITTDPRFATTWAGPIARFLTE